jgi:hypothetical protein
MITKLVPWRDFLQISSDLLKPNLVATDLVTHQHIELIFQIAEASHSKNRAIWQCRWKRQ